MTQDEIIEMARDSGMDLYGLGKDRYRFVHHLETFVKLVAAKATEEANARANASWTLMCEKMVAFEREACAKLCDGLADMHEKMNQWGSHKTADTLAQAIRARGEA